MLRRRIRTGPGGECGSRASELVWRADRLGHDDLGRFGGAPDRADEGLRVRVGHERLELPGMLRQLGLERPTAIMRLAARRSARRYRRELAATG